MRLRRAPSAEFPLILPLAALTLRVSGGKHLSTQFKSDMEGAVRKNETKMFIIYLSPVMTLCMPTTALANSN
jgi:hypothetical protein